MKQWDAYKQPAVNVCPEKYCFFWHDGKCDEAFKGFNEKNDCSRKNTVSICDWYEPNEPELERDGFPWFYFIVSTENLVDEMKEKYDKESEQLWRKTL